MKRKLKKLFRLFLVFLSSFALVCLCLPAKATAQEYNGNSYTYKSAGFNGKMIFDYVVIVAESLGYLVPESIEEFSPELIQFFNEYGVNFDGLNGKIIDLVVPDINIDLSNQNLIEFFSDVKNWDLNSADNGKDKLLLDLFTKYWSYTDNQTIYTALENKNALNPRSVDNVNKFVRYKAYALSRGSLKDIPSTEVTFDRWANAQEITFKWFRPEYFLSYGEPSIGGWIPYSGASFDPYLGYETYDYSTQPYGLTGVGIYENGLFTTAMEYTETGFYITDCRFDVVVSNNYGGGAVAVYSSTFGGTPIVPVSNCHIVNDCILVPDDVNNPEMRFYVHQNNILNCDVKIYTENFYSGGVAAPDKPIYYTPTSSDSSIDRDIYNYIKTDTDRLIDELDINDIGKILETSDDYGWFTFPLQVYNELGDVLLDNYSENFIFDISEIDLSFVAEGLKFPARRFSFSPSEDLDNDGYSLFLYLQYIIAFGYIWALVLWGRSLILRIGSDTVHHDYEK